jgi:hypothetical protein
MLFCCICLFVRLFVFCFFVCLFFLCVFFCFCFLFVLFFGFFWLFVCFNIVFVCFVLLFFVVFYVCFCFWGGFFLWFVCFYLFVLSSNFFSYLVAVTQALVFFNKFWQLYTNQRKTKMTVKYVYIKIGCVLMLVYLH